DDVLIREGRWFPPDPRENQASRTDDARRSAVLRGTAAARGAGRNELRVDERVVREAEKTIGLGAEPIGAVHFAQHVGGRIRGEMTGRTGVNNLANGADLLTEFQQRIHSLEQVDRLHAL